MSHQHPRQNPHWKRWLFLLHRWLGIGGCALFAMWFVSGMVMMYVGYPKLTASERLAHLPVLDSAAAASLLSPHEALDAAGLHGPLQSLRLAIASGGRAVYLAVPQRVHEAGSRRAAPGSATVVVDAQSGAVLRAFDAAHVLASARAFAGPDAALHHAGAIGEDVFTHSRGLDAHRPLHVVEAADREATRLYVSGTTGEVVRDAPRAERLWNYAGAWIHWLYPLRGNLFDPFWADIVNGLSIFGIVLALSGTAVGLLRWRFSGRYKSGLRSPYRGAVMRWHHMLGLAFAAVTLSWIFSGLMSMNPWGIFNSAAPPLRTEAMNGAPLRIGAAHRRPQQLLAAAGPGVRELRWTVVDGRVLVLASAASGPARIVDAASATAAAVDPSALRAAVARLVPAPLQRIELLTAYDTYYYAREPHTMTGGSEKPLPVWRAVFADAHRSWVHVDPHTGAVLERSDERRRASRWLFAMLHSWDWLPLLERRPLWDLALLLASLGGAALSLSGVVLGWRRLGRKLRPAARLTSPPAPPR